MTRISTEPARPFERRLYLTAGLLAAACLLLALLTSRQGVRVRSAALDTANITRRANQRLLLQLNQVPGTVTAKQIAVEPNALFSAVSGGKTIGMQFEHPLRNNTQYTITIRLQSGERLRYAFKTAPADLYYVRTDSGGSKVYRHQLGAGPTVTGDRLVTAAGTINDFLVLNDSLIYTDLNRKHSGQNELLVQNMANGSVRHVKLPGKGLADSLRANPDGTGFGFIFAPDDYTKPKSLWLCNLGTLATHQVTGASGKPLNPIDWQFDRTGSALAALDGNSLLWLVPQHGPAAPLGQYGGLDGFTYDNKGIVVDGRQGGTQILQLTATANRPLTALADDEYIVAALPFNTRQGSITYQDQFATGGLWSQVFANQNGRETLLYRQANQSLNLSSGALSPNDQYVALQTPGANGSTLVRIVDVSDGGVAASVTGSVARWAL